MKRIEIIPHRALLIRHGQSERNIANAQVARMKGDKLIWRMRGQHEGEARLTEQGVNEAKAIGAWLTDQLSRTQDPERRPRVYAVSPFIRALETAGYMGIAGATWQMYPFLAERSWGEMNDAFCKEYRAGGRFADWKERFRRYGFFWRPHGGESFMELAVRVKAEWEELCEEASNGTLVVVAHGEVIQVLQMLIEGISPLDFKFITHLPNASVLEYRSRNPETGDYARKFHWARVVCPWNPTEHNRPWRYFEAPRYSNKDLLAIANRYPRHT